MGEIGDADVKKQIGLGGELLVTVPEDHHNRHTVESMENISRVSLLDRLTGERLTSPVQRLQMPVKGRGKFRSDGFNWMGNDDLLAFSDEQLITSVALIKKGVDEYEKWRDKQTLFIYFFC